jgi:bifunctional non-homologous end joining protein LigD
VWDRFEERGDPFRGVLEKPQDLSHALAAMSIPRTPVPAPADEPVPEAAQRAPGRSRSAEAIARSRDPKLDRYVKMRDLETTPEPAGGTASDAGNSFVIQRHDATRLHYDLRLERDGVLVSWAVPKGLPFVKGERHLAVQTEDHPMEYGSFEGGIPEGHYGAGVVRIWDRGTYELVEWTDRKVSFRLHGERHHGEYHLVKTRGERDWLVLMASASEEEPLVRPPAFQPMLAAAGYQPFDAPGWWFEPKFDGVRSLVYLEGEAVRLVSRTGRDQSSSYPELQSVYRRIHATNAVLDGEIVATNEAGQASFELLQQRMNLASAAEIKRMQKAIPVELVAFDLLWLDGEDLTPRPLSERRSRLVDIVAEGRGLRLIYWVEDGGEAFYDAAKGLGIEGIIAKRSQSRYTPGRRSEDWRKIKILKRQDCVILGWTPGQGRRGAGFGALLLGVYRDGELIWTGQVGTGFTDRLVADLVARLKEIQVDQPAITDSELRRSKGARWVRPELVCEVEYLQITGSGKLRAPSFKGLRPDKLPEDCILEPA